MQVCIGCYFIDRLKGSRTLQVYQANGDVTYEPFNIILKERQREKVRVRGKEEDRREREIWKLGEKIIDNTYCKKLAKNKIIMHVFSILKLTILLKGALFITLLNYIYSLNKTELLIL